MPTLGKYVPELRERVVRLGIEAMVENPSLSLNVEALGIAARVGVVPDTLPGWAKQVRVHQGTRWSRPRHLS